MFEITCTILLNIAYIIYKAELKFMQIRYDYEFSIFVNHILLNFTLLTEIWLSVWTMNIIESFKM